MALGYVLALVTQAFAYPLFGITTTLATDSALAAVFTAVSLLRSYLVRRAFETFAHCALVPSIKRPLQTVQTDSPSTQAVRNG